MDVKTVQEYVNEAQSALKTSPNMDEANTKAVIINEFIKLLDWRITNNTELEYSVKAFGNTYKVDYAFVDKDSPGAFIEAKRAGKSLKNKHNEKMSSYMKNEDVDHGILTNAKEYIFFSREIIDSRIKVNITAEIELNRLPDNLSLLKRYENSELYNERNNMNGISNPPYKCEDAIVLIENGHIVESFEKESFQSDAMEKAVEFLIRERDLIDKISIPYIPRNKKNAVMNDSPEHYTGKEMSSYKQPASGYYLDTSMSRKNKERVIHQMAKKCGLYADFNW
jgi:hypothetical protein